MITATGLEVVVLGELSLTVDCRKIVPNDLHVYKGMMFSGLPNFAWRVRLHECFVRT